MGGGEGYLVQCWSDHGGRRAVVRPTVELAERLQLEEEERKRCRRREFAERRGKTSRWLCLSPVRIWVGGEAETPSVGGGGMFL